MSQIPNPKFLKGATSILPYIIYTTLHAETN